MKKRVAVLALQGDFAEHELSLNRSGAETFQIRQMADLEQRFDALVIPGGESTVIGKLLRELGLFDLLQAQICGGLPVLATCAGLILLANQIQNDDTAHLQTLNVVVRRNAYGRQLGSFYTEGQFDDMIGVPMSFIRAPSIESVGKGVMILSEYNGKATAVRQGNQVALAYHPELLDDCRIYRWFLDNVVPGGK